MRTDRRTVLTGPAAFAAAPLAGAMLAPSQASAQSASRAVFLANDTAFKEPEEFASDLSALTSRYDGALDIYMEGGAVGELEQAFASLLGKEACVFLPTGTLANHLAVKTLCGPNPRALCLHDSHVFRDENDSLPTLGEIALVPFPKGRIAPTTADLDEAFDIATRGPRPVSIGAISLESPIRRIDGQMIPFADIERIAAKAREYDTRLHLDGARLLLAPPGFDFAGYVAPFDTVYVSLYKYLGAPFGAVLAGSAGHIETIRRQAAIYGSTLFNGWVAALPALDGLKSFRQDYEAAWARGEELLSAISASGYSLRAPVGGMGTNVHHILMSEDQAKAILTRAAAREIYFHEWSNGALPVQINTSILNQPLDDIASIFAG